MGPFSIEPISLGRAALLSVGLVLYTLILSAQPACPADPAQGPQDLHELGPIHDQLRHLRGQIDILRRHMGVSQVTALDLRIRDVSLPDLFFQTRALFGKVSRLSYEILRVEEELPETPEGRVQTGDVLHLVQASAASMGRVMRELELEDAGAVSRSQTTLTPDTLFLDMLAFNRQVNAMLERPYTPTDVFLQVTVAVGYAARQLAAFPQAERFPREPPFEKDKQPVDVYRRLLVCLQLISSICRAAGLAGLVVEHGRIEDRLVTPGDVFDLAALVVARLDYLHKQRGRGPLPKSAPFPGRRFPSDVFQRAGLLERQLELLRIQMDRIGAPSKQSP